VNGNTRDWAVVGGGILGSALALRLAEHGNSVTLYEQAPQIGGLAAPFQLGDVTWDRFYHVTLQSDSALLSLLQDLDLEREMRWVATRTALYDDGRLFSVSNVADYLRLRSLGPISKARIGATVLRAAYLEDWRPLEQITAEDWLIRWSGPRAYETFWLPLLRSKLGDRHDQASAAFIWAIIRRLYAARRAGAKQDLFGYVSGGYARVLQRLERRLTDSGVEVRTSSEVRSVVDIEGRIRVDTPDAMDLFDAAVVTAPSPEAVRIVPQLSPRERAAHESVGYQGVVCVSVLLDRPLGGFYVTNITDTGLPFTGVIEMTALVDPAEFGGRTLVYLPKYVSPDDDLFASSDEDIEATFIDGLARMYPVLHEARIEATAVSRARHVLPISTIDYSTRLPPMTTTVPGVHIVNTSHIVNGTLNIDETLQLVDRALPNLLVTATPGVRR
jgi:protoporphyrinogen oxidase